MQTSSEPRELVPTGNDTDGAIIAARPESGAEVLLRDGTAVFVRPIHAEDIELERQFIKALSPNSRRFRFLETMQSPGEALLKQLTVINPSTDAAYVALVGEGARQREVGVARFSARADGQDCEFAVTVDDEWQNRGLGSLLMGRLIEVARARGIHAMHSSDAADNTRMRQFADHLQFEHKTDPEDPHLVLYTVNLRAESAAVLKD